MRPLRQWSLHDTRDATLNNQPTSHPKCNPAYFEFVNLPESVMQRLYSRLLTAKVTGEPINIGFDQVGNTCNSYIQAHRVG